ncbi:3-hydroxyanthranilate 3,4-dioxygenase [Haliangium sp.]|uniref:3-hydroxyanthranilate 3,4-dioxygenase n=1 Tax=Haliangium sp. TaxID=2663208 RepID=UPI003D116D0D
MPDPIRMPVDVSGWVEASLARPTAAFLHHELFWDQGFIVKLFDGPTPDQRSDFHINTSPEFFYQLRGDMFCRLREHGRVVDVTVKPGEMFVIPALVPHLNRRAPGSLGLVIHQQRQPGAKDAVAWYCDECGHQLHRVDYDFEDLLAQLPPLVRAFLADDDKRTCGRCGWVMPPGRGRM